MRTVRRVIGIAFLASFFLFSQLPEYETLILGDTRAEVTNITSVPSSPFRRAILAAPLAIEGVDGVRSSIPTGSAVEYHPYLHTLTSVTAVEDVVFLLREGAFNFKERTPIQFDTDVEDDLVVTGGVLASYARTTIGPFLVDAEPNSRVVFSAHGLSSVTAEYARGRTLEADFEFMKGSLFALSNDMHTLVVTAGKESTMELDGMTFSIERAEIDFDMHTVRSVVLAPRSFVVIAAQQVPARILTLSENETIESLTTAGAFTFENMETGEKTSYKYGAKLFVAHDRSMVAPDPSALPDTRRPTASPPSSANELALVPRQIMVTSDIDAAVNPDFVAAYDTLQAKRARVRFLLYGESDSPPLYDGEVFIVTDRRTGKSFVRLERTIDVPDGALIEILITLVTGNARFLKASAVFRAEGAAIPLTISSAAYVYSPTDVSPLPRIGRPLDVALTYRVDTTDVLARMREYGDVPADNRIGTFSVFPAWEDARAYTNITFPIRSGETVAGTVRIPRVLNAGELYVRAVWYAPDGGKSIASARLPIFASTSSGALGSRVVETNVTLQSWEITGGYE